MVYTLLFSFTVIYLYTVRIKAKNAKEFSVFFLPVAGLLILILGLQENVGTDYYAYYQLGQGLRSVAWMANRNEFLFIRLVKFVQKYGTPQMLFGLVASIQVAFLMLISYEVNKLEFKLHDFFFLYFALALVFFNQFNGIRQYIAVYIIVYALLQLVIYEKKLVFFLLVGLAGLFHSSALYFLPFIVLQKMKDINWPYRRTLLVLGILFIIAMADINHYIEYVLVFTKYRSYIGHGYFRRMDILGIVTKLPKLLIVLYSAFFLEKYNLKQFERRLLNLGYMACGVLIMSFSATIIWRFYQYVDLFLIFPVLILFDKKEYGKRKFFIGFALLLILISKIILFPRGEYLYNSIVLPTRNPIHW
ncbi:MAG: EpsG family protein [Clostridiaceae bacterium]|nr:EpsG family protein [Clostridiaceae bacterium]